MKSGAFLLFVGSDWSVCLGGPKPGSRLINTFCIKDCTTSERKAVFNISLFLKLSTYLYTVCMHACMYLHVCMLLPLLVQLLHVFAP